ncbi:putative cell division control protein [Xylariaceae sp. FL0594]|nr:putative cell division control protein [Xylariaceae sp. FL0594]
MENLLSLAFDNLSSYDGAKIRKGLRQVEGLLANMCLSRPQSGSGNGNSSDSGGSRERCALVSRGRGGGEESSSSSSALPTSKSLSELADDPAFHEFFKLQEGFEWNVAVRIVNTLDRLLAKGSDGSNDLLILSALDLLQGLMLLHPPSKALFSREMHMNLLLDLIEPDFCPAIQSATLLTLVTALIETPQNARTFENLDGLLAVTSLFRSRGTSRDVKLKLIEFIYFYLMPETPNSGARPPRSSSPADGSTTRTLEEKQALLGRHLNSVEDLVKDIKRHTLFGGVVS